jgi:hypothetical protein
MPQLVALHKRKADKGLAVIGMHVQNATDDEINKVIKDMKIKFPVVKGGSTPGRGNGIPHSVVFDSAGKMVFEGHPSEKGFEKAVDTALKAVAGGAGGSSSGLGPKPGSGLTPSKTDAKPLALIAEREWTNADGKKMSAALISLSGNNATFKMKTGKTFTYDITKLTEEDQTAIKEAAAPKEEGDKKE